MDKKYIHYCWFGNNPLPKLAEKCIESWKKYLPDYEIIKWSEDNVDINECPFIKEAYENKKWAFVADYARTKAIYEMGGIYFDTDMEVTKDISDLLKDDSFLGVEDSGKIACGVWFERNPHSFLSTALLEKYRSFDGFSVDDMCNISIPLLITEILEKCGFQYNSQVVQHLDNGMVIYPRDYFYPYSYNRENNIFTDNTCMIHYYDASWVPFRDKIELKMVRLFGRSRTISLIKFCQKIKYYLRCILKTILFPIVIYRNIKRKRALINDEYLLRINNTLKLINEKSDKDYITMYNKNWLGVTSATIELFDNIVDCGEILRKKDGVKIAKAILDSDIKQVVFSSLTKGEKYIISYIKNHNSNIKIKTFWHGSHSQILDDYGWQRNMEIIELHKKGFIDVAAICKESLVKFYEYNNIKTKFITNRVVLNKKIENNSKSNGETRIGIYAARCEDWRKNMFAEIAAAAQIPNVVIDMVPLSEKAKKFAEKFGVAITGVSENLSRDALIERMSKNSVNLYVTFSECSPMLPLESFEAGVPCVTGNNNHYFKTGNLNKFTVVNNEENPFEIVDRINDCINNKKIIMEEYKKFRSKNIENSKNDVSEFIKM